MVVMAWLSRIFAEFVVYILLKNGIVPLYSEKLSSCDNFITFCLEGDISRREFVIYLINLRVWSLMILMQSVLSYLPRSRDSISNAIRHMRDRLPESAQCDANKISWAVALFAFFFPILYDMPESSRPVLRCHIFSSSFASLFLLN